MDCHKQAISSISLGWHASHTLERKLSAAASNGFSGVEMFYIDLLAFPKSRSMSPLDAAPIVRALCAEKDLSIVCLGSFDNFEGAQSPLTDRLATALDWISIAHGLGTTLIQIPSNDDKSAKGDEVTIVEELRKLADLGSNASPPISFAYEALAWGIHVADWEESLRIIQLVDRGNFGLCLDTYHVLSRLWADPMSKTGVRPGGRATLNASIRTFLDQCPAESIFYIQLSDAERCLPPLLPGHPAFDSAKDSTHAWCSWGRLFPFEEERGAYLPLLDICKAWLVEKEWKGWVSMEIFHRGMKRESAGPGHWAQRGRLSFDKLTLLLKE